MISISKHGVKDIFFHFFDSHICALMATPLMEAGLQNRSVTVCLWAIGMGAVVTVDTWNYLMNCLEADLKVKVETVFGGMCGLATVFAQSGQPEVLKHMLEIGAEVNETSSDGTPALNYAAWGGYVEICCILLACGVEVDKKGNAGYTALNIAAQTGHLKVCELLLTHNAEFDNKTDVGCTPLLWAAGSGFVEVCKLLLDYRELNYRGYAYT